MHVGSLANHVFVSYYVVVSFVFVAFFKLRNVFATYGI